MDIPHNLNYKRLKKLEKLSLQDAYITYKDCNVVRVVCDSSNPSILVHELLGPEFNDRVDLSEIEWKKIKVYKPIKNPFVL